jgi:hypothetical protein
MRLRGRVKFETSGLSGENGAEMIKAFVGECWLAGVMENQKLVLCFYWSLVTIIISKIYYKSTYIDFYVTWILQHI